MKWEILNLFSLGDNFLNRMYSNAVTLGTFVNKLPNKLFFGCCQISSVVYNVHRLRVLLSTSSGHVL